MVYGLPIYKLQLKVMVIVAVMGILVLVSRTSSTAHLSLDYALAFSPAQSCAEEATQAALRQ